MITLTFPHCHVDIFNETRCLRTVFDDGLTLYAAANDDKQSVDKAYFLGYTDTWSMTREHEIAHTLFGLSLGLKWSRVLHHAAYQQVSHEREITHEESALEEQIIVAIQKRVNRIPITAKEHAILNGTAFVTIIARLFEIRAQIAAETEASSGTH